MFGSVSGPCFSQEESSQLCEGEAYLIMHGCGVRFHIQPRTQP